MGLKKIEIACPKIDVGPCPSPPGPDQNLLSPFPQQQPPWKAQTLLLGWKEPGPFTFKTQPVHGVSVDSDTVRKGGTNTITLYSFPSIPSTSPSYPSSPL